MPDDRAGVRHVAVVGGGVSGLVLARDLARAGVRVTVFEAAERCGGRIQAADIRGTSIDIGAEAFATRGGAVAALLGELGLADRVIRPAPLGSWLVAGSDGAAVPLPPAGAMGIPAAPLGRDARRALGLAGSVRAALEPLLPARVGSGSTTLAQLVRVRAGKAVLDRLVRPVTLGVSSAAPELIPLTSTRALTAEYARTGSLIRAAGRLRDSAAAAGGAVASLRGGMSELITALVADCVAAGVTIHTSAPIHSLTDVGDALERSESAAPAGTPGACGPTDIVLAVPELAARAILGHPVAEIVTTPVEVIALALAADHPAVRPLAEAPRGTGALVTAGGPNDVITAKAVTHITRKWPDADRNGPVGASSAGMEIVRLSYGRAGSSPETAALDDAAAQRLALRDASRLLGTELPDTAVLGFTRQSWGMPVHGDRPKPQPPAGVHLLGDWISGVGLATLIPAARELAQQLMRAPGSPSARFTGAPRPHHQISERH
ncbi:oxygen-dependent protoporphyrinogen oxidase [Leucobacter luti]|uniref:protoporphyrinogen/coproporphyrinogen oxidase n=1 Tax=Leucobacter luti TaxID=340320 RepID=UPI001043F5EF|nr:FAD-dependent oxidoreductase [Leucobacter luti]MCW2287281.1 oxygen-dependent protoporphyrinogen oxidase [Leucobacter luti]TCK41504.1 oxygen-dependent protoporphyrinogen oxidase [Leucobacter luti]